MLLYQPLNSMVRAHRDVQAVARAIYDERRFGDLPILGDVLEEAGCTDGNLLNHCRSGAEHSRNCSVLQVVLRNHVRDLNWLQVYTKIGLRKVYLENLHRFTSICESEESWTIPILSDKGKKDTLTIARLANALKEGGSGWWSWYENFDREINHSDRDPKDGPYAISVKAIIEADKENQGKSANQLGQEGHVGMIAHERLTLEVAYFLATQNHLDHKNSTLCPGSHDQEGGVPYVGWYPVHRKVYLYWYDPDGRRSNLHSRSVRVLLAPPSAKGGGKQAVGAAR